MAGINRTTGKATDLITFSRASGGTALRKISYGPELVTNGTFDTADGWTLGGGWAIASGTLNWTGGYNRATFPVGADAFEAGKVYLITGAVSGYTSGRVNVYLAPSGNPVVAFASLPNADGTFSVFLSPTATVNEMGFIGNDASGARSIDNISVKEVLFDQPDGTLQLFNHPEDIPRIDYSPDGTVKGLLIEEQRTNLIVYSNNQSTKPVVNATITYDGETSVLGTTSNTFTKTGSYGNVKIQSTVPAGTYTGSFFVKAGTLSVASLAFLGNTQIERASIDLSTGVVSNEQGSSFYTFEEYANGWKRISITSTLTETCAFYAYPGVYLSATTGSVLVDGFQLEAGAFPTSYIPTSGQTKTRAADVASIPVSAFGYNQSEGTVVVEATKSLTTANGRYFELSNASGNSRFSVTQQLTTITGFGLTEFSTICQLPISTAGIDEIKAGFTFTENDFAFCLNGGSVSTDTAGAFPDDLSTLFIGKYPVSDTFQLNGHIKSIQYFPRRLTNAQLQELTT